MTDTKQKLFITFAGPVGSSKSPIATYLSINLGLPVFNNDNIRSEVIADLLKFDQEEYIKRRDQRIKVLLNNNDAFIYDASIDRAWNNRLKEIKDQGYHFFIISLDLSKKFLNDIYKAKGAEDLEHYYKTYDEHQEFLTKYSDEINLHITDETFPNRLELSLETVQKWFSTPK